MKTAAHEEVAQINKPGLEDSLLVKFVLIIDAKISIGLFLIKTTNALPATEFYLPSA